MSKISVKSVILKNNELISEISTKALKNDNIIIFYDDNNTLMKLQFTSNFVTVIRENDEMVLTMSFKNKKEIKSSCQIKSLDSVIDVKTITKDLIINDNSIKIIYDLYMSEEYNDSFVYSIEWSE